MILFIFLKILKKKDVENKEIEQDDNYYERDIETGILFNQTPKIIKNYNYCAKYRKIISRRKFLNYN